MFSVQCSMFSVQCSVFNVQCSMFNVQCSMFNVQCSMFNVQCSMFDASFTPFYNLLNLLSSVLTSQPNRSITHSFRPSPFNPAFVASRQSRLAAAACSCRAARLGLNFGPCRNTSLIRCSFVTAPHFKSRFGSKLQYRGTSIIVLNGVRFTLNFNNNGLSPSIPYKSHR